ncbi:MAG: hypothetical protein AAFR12_22820 [Cyanobacteria bacterium J06626_6]
MPLAEIIPAVNQLSHEDKLRLIQVLLIAVAKEDGCELSVTDSSVQEGLLRQLATIDAFVWSPHDAHGAAQVLSDLLVASKKEENA